MANIQVPANPGFPDVYQWELNDDVIGGPNGIATRPIRELTERTANLNQRTLQIETLVKTDLFGAESKIDPYLFASDRKKLTLKAGTIFEVGTGNVKRFLVGDEDMEIDAEAVTDTASPLVNGKDYYVFLCINNQGNVVTRTSLTKTNPQNFAVENVLLIGGFHTLCVNAGVGMNYEEGGESKLHPLNGFMASDILPASVWCHNHRPYSEPEGMVYIQSLDFWCDIYLQSGSGYETKSVYQGAITRTRQYVDFVEDQICVNKELLDDSEFAAAMMGSNEMTTVAGANEAGATTNGAGGRVDTANRRMLSIYGVEEGCGSLWQWLRTTSAAGYEGSMHGQRSAPGVTPIGYGQFWSAINRTVSDSNGVNLMATSWAPQSGDKGGFWYMCGALRAGGAWNFSASCGSRARSAFSARSAASSSIGGRGRSRAMR